MPASSAFSDNLREKSLTDLSAASPLKNPKLSKKSSKPTLSPANSAFLERLVLAYPEFSFKPGRKFLFRPKTTISYTPDNKNFPLLLLHETAHALLGHYSFSTSLERLTIERDAWKKTRSLCREFNIPFDNDFAESNLDTYRDWLHQKTLCKTCGATCLEVGPNSLFCPFCQKTYIHQK